MTFRPNEPGSDRVPSDRIEPNKAELRLAARYVDGEMAPDQRSAFSRRLQDDARLRLAVSEVEALRSWFEPGRQSSGALPSPGFSASVLAAARRLPSRDELRRDGETDEESIVDYARRVSLAAAVLLGALLLAYVGDRVLSGPSHLMADNDRVRIEMERLDEAIRARTTGAETRDR